MPTAALVSRRKEWECMDKPPFVQNPACISVRCHRRSAIGAKNQQQEEVTMRFWVLALCFAGLTSNQALAQEMTFAIVDADRSGLISIEEVEAAGLEWTPEEFAAADADADEYLNQEEFETAIAR
jgi:hypothetical protein